MKTPHWEITQLKPKINKKTHDKYSIFLGSTLHTRSSPFDEEAQGEV